MSSGEDIGKVTARVTLTVELEVDTCYGWIESAEVVDCGNIRFASDTDSDDWPTAQEVIEEYDRWIRPEEVDGE